VPIARVAKTSKQATLEFDQADESGQAYRPNDLVNQIRDAVSDWRRMEAGDRGVTHETSRLLEHWRGGGPKTTPFFCQLEAVETAIWLGEVAPKSSPIHKRLAEGNKASNPGLFRLALKMATGSGKTTVMAMLIAWQAINAARGRKTYSDSFLIVCPGITIRDRLRVLMPSDPDNYYEARGFVPDDMLGEVRNARIVITNYHAFKHRETAAISKQTREVLAGRDGSGPVTIETDGQMLRRVCKELLDRKNIVVINDEAHHCYERKPGDSDETVSTDDAGDARANTEAARLWINGIRALDRMIGVRTVYDLSATPFFLRGSGYREGELFPWVVSDFALIDAIECGIVKIPRVPVSDNALGLPMPVWRRLWPEIRDDLPKEGARTKKAKGQSLDATNLPPKLLGALHALYDHYEKVYDQWRPEFRKAGADVPPVFIVVCQNTSHSKLVYDYIAGYQRTEKLADGSAREVTVPGALKLFRNHDEDGKPLARPMTLLIDSNELDSGEALSAEYKKVAAAEIEAFKAQVAKRDGEGAAQKLTDADVLREVMNTVGRQGQLGEQVRCVVSVSMLTEGWDTNTVTHVLGVRAFGTQLLCEQVVGRGLRRVSYDPDDNGMFSPEYANVFGIPFDFASEQGGDDTFKPPKPTVRVRAIESREALEMRFPRVQGYRVRLPNEPFPWKWDEDSKYVLSPDVSPTRAQVEDILGQGEAITLDNYMTQRTTTIAFHVAGHALRTKFRDEDGNLKPWLFPRLLRATREWLDTQLSCVGGTKPGLLLWRELADIAAQKIWNAHVRGATAAGLIGAEEGEVKGALLPIIDPYNPMGSTRFVDFRSSKPTWTTRADMSHVNLVVTDSDWEAAFCEAIEQMDDVAVSYVKNQGLQFWVPYTAGNSERRYFPDYVVQVDDGHGPADPLNLVVEIKGERDLFDQLKREAIETHWVPAVNNDGRFGRWDFIEIGNPYEVERMIREKVGVMRRPAE
jgi:type III restriction enzyme